MLLSLEMPFRSAPCFCPEKNLEQFFRLIRYPLVQLSLPVNPPNSKQSKPSNLQNLSIITNLLFIPLTPAVPVTQIFITTDMNGLGLHPWVKTRSRQIMCHLLKAPRLTEFAKLVSVLSDFDQAGEQSMTDQVLVGSLGNVARRLVEDQKLHLKTTVI